MNAIFDTRAGSEYDDDIVQRYHFPKQYLSVATSAVGDWIIYREPYRNGGRKAYVAVARVSRVEPDPADLKLSYARIDSFLPFDRVVPMEKVDGRYYESRLNQVAKKSLVGAALQGRSMRQISEDEFGTITRAGLGETLAHENAIRLELDPAHMDDQTAALVNAPIDEQERKIQQILTNRKIRDASFRRQVVDAYDNRCAVTGLRIVNGGGKSEAQAAHIWSVSGGGPDVVRNGIALSATVHWLFDRHLISLTNDYGLLVAHNRVPSELQGLFARQMQRILLPKDEHHWPHLAYVQKHREAYVG